MDVGMATAVAVAVGVDVDVLAKALQALANLLGTKYGIALALVDRETHEVLFATTTDVTPEVAATMFTMQAAEHKTVFFDRQM